MKKILEGFQTETGKLAAGVTVGALIAKREQVWEFLEATVRQSTPRTGYTIASALFLLLLGKLAHRKRREKESADRCAFVSVDLAPTLPAVYPAYRDCAIGSVTRQKPKRKP